MPSTDMALGARWSFEAIGTRWDIDTEIELPTAILAKVTARIDQFDLTWSRFRTGSLVRQMAEHSGTYNFGPEAGPLLDLYEELYQRTDGAVTPLIGEVLEQLGYDAQYSMQAQDGPRRARPYEQAVSRRGDRLSVYSPVTFDVGAAGKGYLVDLVLNTLQDNGIDRAVVDASGDMRHLGTDVQRIGLEDPRDPGKVIGVANLAGGALCASAVNRRSWGDGLHHVVHPATGEPVRDVIATWVCAPTALVADGLATALFFVGPGALRGLDFSYVRMFSGGRVEWSTNFDGEIFR